MENTPTAPEAPKKKSFFRKPLGCLLSLVVGGLLFIILLVAFGLWFAGSNKALAIASGIFADKSGGALTFAENDNNLFAGRVHLKGIEITNPSRFTDKQCLKLNEIHAEVNPFSVMGDRIEVPVVTFDLGNISLVGAEKWYEDNNLLDLKKAFVPAGAAAPEPKPEEKPAQPAPKVPFHIGKMTIRMGTIRIVSHATVAGQPAHVIAEEPAGLSWEFTDVTDENAVEKVWPVIKNDLYTKLPKLAAKLAAAVGKDELNKLLKGAGAEATAALESAKAEASAKATEAAAQVSEAATAATEKATAAAADASAKATEAANKAKEKATGALGGFLKKK